MYLVKLGQLSSWNIVQKVASSLHSYTTNTGIWIVHIYQISPIQIDPNGVVELLKNLITHKAAGLIKFQLTYSKKQTEIAPILMFIFQASLQQSSVPSDWKIANIVPLFKKAITASQTTTDLYH